MPHIGETAPEFTLRDQHRTAVTRADLEGNKALLIFIPFPFTGVCTGELCAIRDGLSDLSRLDANVAVITCDTPPANRRWAEEHGFEFPILSDFWPHGEVSRACDVFDETLGVAVRTTFVLDEEGRIDKVIASPELGTPRQFDLYVDALAPA